MDISNVFGLAPILMNEADGGGDGGGGGTAVATVETAITTTGDGGGTGSGDGTEEAALTTTDPDGTGQHVDGARKPANPGLEALRAHADPEVKKFANTVSRAVAFRNDIGKMFPGVNPKTAIESLQRDMVSLAGRSWNTPDPKDPNRRTGLQQVRDRLAEIEEIDLQFYGANPQLLDGMTSDDDGKAAFAKLAPHMESKWKEVAPNAWAAKTARQIIADLKGAQIKNDRGDVLADADVPYRVQRLSLALGSEGVPTEINLSLARQEIAVLAMYIQRLNGLAALAPEVFTKSSDVADAKLAERERKIAEREAQNRDADWNNARQITANQVTTKTWNALVKGHDVSADDQEECLSLFHIRFNNAIKAREPRADENRKGYIESDDRDGYLAYENYLMTTYGVPTLKEQVRRMLVRMVPLKPGQQRTTTAAATTTANGQPVRPTQGYTKVGERPPLHVISNEGRTKEMVMNKQAILRIPWKDLAAGKKICW